MAQKGDFCVGKQGKNFFILRIMDKDKEKLVIEQIEAPFAVCKDKNWEKWLYNMAPGHTSWIAYSIDFSNNTLIEAFSFTRKSWLQLRSFDNFFLQIAKTRLEKVEDSERKKIGSPPLGGETDYRSLWNPPLFFKGKKLAHPKYDVYKTIWPHDQSELSDKIVQMYFSKNISFFFPFWIEILSDHYGFSCKIIDAGKNLTSPQEKLPLRPLAFFTKPRYTSKGLIFTLRSPKYYTEFIVEATLVNDQNTPPISCPYSLSEKAKEKLELVVDTKNLKKNALYIWKIIPINSSSSLTWKEPIFNPIKF